jgi:hypothetical protein
MTDKEILKLAKKVGFSFDEDDETWFCFEKELLKFAALIYTEGFKVGYDEGWESSNVSTKMNTWSSDDD